VEEVSSAPASSPEAAKAAFTKYETQETGPARLAEGRSTEFVQQLARGAEQLQRSGQTSLRMQLYPEDLGRINLRLTGSSEGVRVSITADLASTGSLLERHMGDLKQALSESGVTVLGLAVGSGQDQRQHGADSSARGKDGGAFAPSGEPAAEKREASVMPGRSSSSSYIDYRI
jgi:flagellar hook-length control protein FliK